jgi:hypothetical protein
MAFYVRDRIARDRSVSSFSSQYLPVTMDSISCAILLAGGHLNLVKSHLKRIKEVTSMKYNLTRIVALTTGIILAAGLAFAAPNPSKAESPQSVPPFPGTLVNARYVYVTSYDGDQFDINLLPEDREAINSVQDAIEKWGKFTLVYKPHEADIVLMVTSRPSEDILAVYDAHGWPRNEYLWRMTGRNGLQPSETPLVTNLEKAFGQATAAKK